jgi:hypothetical protein
MKTQQKKDNSSKDTQENKTSLQKKVATVTPDNDNGKTGLPAEKDRSNKGKGPMGEDL